MENESRRVANVNTELTCEFAANSYQNLLPGVSSPVCLWEEDAPGALFNVHKPSELILMELKCW